VLSKDEAKFVFEKGSEQFIVGSGQMGNVHLSPEAEAYFTKKGFNPIYKVGDDRNCKPVATFHHAARL